MCVSDSSSGNIVVRISEGELRTAKVAHSVLGLALLLHTVSEFTDVLPLAPHLAPHLA